MCKINQLYATVFSSTKKLEIKEIKERIVGILLR